MEKPRHVFIASISLGAVIFAALGCARPVEPGRAESSAQPAPYLQRENIVYGESSIPGLMMDVFIPSSASNHHGIVDVVSGAYYSDRSGIQSHRQAKMFDILCRHGYTVFAVRPGSVTDWTAVEMAGHVRRAIRYIKCHADDFQIDPDRLGITGGSAGGHLAVLAAVTGHEGQPGAPNKLDRYGSLVKAAGVFFAPTDLLNWGSRKPDFKLLGPLLFHGGIQNKSETEIRDRVRAISPRYQVHQNPPDFLFIHGDADPYIPLRQSQTMADAIEAAGGSARLIVKKGGGHTWPGIAKEIETMAQWFDRELDE